LSNDRERVKERRGVRERGRDVSSSEVDALCTSAPASSSTLAACVCVCERERVYARASERKREIYLLGTRHGPANPRRLPPRASLRVIWSPVKGVLATFCAGGVFCPAAWQRPATKWLPKWLGCEPRLIVMSLDSRPTHRSREIAQACVYMHIYGIGEGTCRDR